jgi:amidohydrolase
MEERQTAARIRARLRAAGLRPQRPLIGTDVIALLRGAKPGPNVTLRADIDALPIREQTGAKHASRVPGRMHACGHDGHAAMLYGAARVLLQLRPELAGSVRFVFQPGEEMRAAGRDLVAAGALRDPKPAAVLALHAWSGLPAGTIASRPGPMMAAADHFLIEVLGKGAHGARPEESIDPVLVGARIVEGLQAIVSRRLAPVQPAVVSVCRFHAGTTSNVIPPRAELEGTCRYLVPTLGRALPRLIRQVVKGVCDSMGARFRLEYHPSYIPTVNDAGIVDLGRRVAQEQFGKRGWADLPHPSMGAEDFAFYLRGNRGAIFRLGMGEKSPGLHTPQFDFNDAALRNGILFFVAATREVLAE